MRKQASVSSALFRHGPIADCPIAQYEYLALEYLEASEGSEVRARLERRYGRANIRRLIATYEEEKANQKWLSTSTMKCPGCQCHIEKTLGCNHVWWSTFGREDMALNSHLDDMLEVLAAFLLPMWTKVKP